MLTNSEELRLESVNLLYDFHKNRDNFSVATLTAVIDCFGVLTKVCNYIKQKALNYRKKIHTYFSVGYNVLMGKIGRQTYI